MPDQAEPYVSSCMNLLPHCSKPYADEYGPTISEHFQRFLGKKRTHQDQVQAHSALVMPDDLDNEALPAKRPRI